MSAAWRYMTEDVLLRSRLHETAYWCLLIGAAADMIGGWL